MAEVIYYKYDPSCRTDADVVAIIAQIDAILASLRTTAMTAVATGQFLEYEYDTGMTKTNIVYRSTDQIIASMEGFEKLRQYYVNKRQPNVVRLVDSKNLKTRF